MSSTTLTGTDISAATRVKTGKFALRKHDYIGAMFAIIATTPVWLSLALPGLGISFIYKHGAWPVTAFEFFVATWPVTAFEVVVLLGAYVSVKKAMPKDGAK